MASKPQVTLTFAGDSSKLESAFSKVGESARKMQGDVGAASTAIGESAGGFDRAGEAADGAEGKAQGFSDTLTGTKDLMDATGEIAAGNYFEGFVLAGQGAADLAGGLAAFVIPAVKNLSTAMIGNAVNAAKSTAAFAVNKGATIGSAIATNTMTIAQKALNVAMRANPIGLVITALLALTAGVVWAYKNVGWFRSAVDTAMRGVRAAFGWAVDAGGRLVGWVKGLPGTIGGYLSKVPQAGQAMLSWFQKLPGRIGGYFGGLASTISGPFRAAFGAVRDFWNNTIGGKGFSIPDWVPGIGGRSFTIPRFHTGGIVPGSLGSETLALLKAGERVTGGSNSAGGGVIVIKSGGSKLDDLLVEVLSKAIRVRGGNVQAVLGR